jgi:hypothetical protein
MLLWYIICMICRVSCGLRDLFFGVRMLGILERLTRIQSLSGDYTPASTMNIKLDRKGRGEGGRGGGGYFDDSTVNDIDDAVDGDTCFGNICRHNDFSFIFLRRLKDRHLFLTR